MIVTKNMIEAGAAALWALTDDAVRHAFNPGREPFPFSGVSDPPLQERYRRMSEACLVAALSPSPQADGEAFEGSIDTDTPLQAAAREAGWALTTLVDISDWQRRDQLSDIIGRLAAALLDSDAPPPQTIVGGLKNAAQKVCDDYERAYGKPCDCATADAALHYGRAQGLEMAADILTAASEGSTNA